MGKKWIPEVLLNVLMQIDFILYVILYYIYRIFYTAYEININTYFLRFFSTL